MTHPTSITDWVTLISAVSAAVVAIVNAIQHKGLAHQMADNHAETLAKLPPKGGS